ncbi:acyl-CoA dehydrogenase [Sulfitobacter aestuarii]|uniref:Acyl-CoA dehydrogenase n=1 Tax=Sulfitobacter aestuarii TaxID=2161676 RepID=A0ABW5U445_9RHOB
MQTASKPSRILRSSAMTGTDPLEDLLAPLAENAMAEDRGSGDIAASLALLRDAGLLHDDGREAPRRTARRLMRIGAVNLSLGRLWEGHVNALYLIRVHGDAPLQAKAKELLAQDGLFGVWGADDTLPLTFSKSGDRLSGGKKFASGLGVLSHAIVTVGTPLGPQLALVDVRDAARADPARWQMPGMRATASGAYDFTGLPLPRGDRLGGPGDYFNEPHFIAGVWRIAALQIGGALGLIDAATAQLREMGRMDNEAQKTRLAPVLMRALAAVELTERAALQAAEAPADRAVALSISARLLTEEVALDTIRAVEQSLGLAHFDAGSVTGRRARDLSVYLRQVARDAFLMRFADHAFLRDGAVWELLE